MCCGCNANSQLLSVTKQKKYLHWVIRQCIDGVDAIHSINSLSMTSECIFSAFQFCVKVFHGYTAFDGSRRPTYNVKRSISEFLVMCTVIPDVPLPSAMQATLLVINFNALSRFCFGSSSRLTS